MEYEELTARKYYELTYSVMPDNKIKQVTGTYTNITYENIQTSTSGTLDSCDLTYKNGTTATIQLPLIDYSTIDAGRFEGIYNVEVDYTGEDSVIATPAQRIEKIAANVDVVITSQLPITYRSITSVDVVGTVRKRTGNNQTGQYGIWCYFDANDNEFWGQWCYNWTGDHTTKVTSGLDTVEIKEVIIDNVYNGRVVSGGLYKLVLHVAVYIESNILKRSSGTLGYNGDMTCTSVDSFKLQVEYGVANLEEVDFEYHVSDTDYSEYPLKITGNEFTTAETTYIASGSNINWQEWMSSRILDSCSKGKLYVNATLKGSFLIENNIILGSEIVIKDINGSYINVNNNGNIRIVLFKVVNIEYTFEGASFKAYVTLLESGYTDSAQTYVIMTNGTHVVTSRGIRVLINNNNNNEEE